MFIMFGEKMKNKILASLLVPALLATAGCAPKIGGNNFSTRNVGVVAKTYKGVVVAARAITISSSNPSSPGVGAGVGAVSGAVLGSTIGQGKGRILGAALGGLAAGAAGHFIEQAATEQQGFEYQVQLENGSIVTVRQGADPVISVGQKVFVTEDNTGGSRVVPDGSR
jgi:outer membrane lipoprotein SlyB